MKWLRRPTRFFVFAGLWQLAVLAITPSIGGEEAAPLPLHTRIDQAIEASPGLPVSELCTDLEFLRRIYLDLTGSVPSIGETRAFLADASPGKRDALIDRLLASPAFVRHMTTTFDVMLMERRPDKHVKQDEWLKYLSDSLAQNKPWDQLARELLNSDGTDEKIRAAAKFYLDRDAEPHLLTRDVGRLFFGMDLACAQCHDHPLVDTYYQVDYYGLHAFLHRGVLFTDKAKKVFYAEQAEGDVKFTSVFTQLQDETRPRLPGELELAEPTFMKGEEYLVAPATGVRPVPKYSRRTILAERSTSGSNTAFNRNIANRMWALMMGRGLVEPLDMHHLDNPPSHPELLQLLADEMVVVKFNLRAFLGELARTRTYQRSLRAPADWAPVVQAAAQRVGDLTAQEQQAAAAWKAITEEVSQLRAEYEGVRKTLTAVLAEWAPVNTAFGAAQKASEGAAKALAEAQQQHQTKRDVADTLASAATKAVEAAAKLAGDAELMQAAQKFQSRAAKTGEEAAAAEKRMTERAAAATKMAEALQVAQAAANQMLAKLQTAQQNAAAARERASAPGQQIRAAELAVQAKQVHLRRAQAVAALNQLAVAADSSQKKVAALQQQIALGKETLAQRLQQLPGLDAAVTTAKAASDEAAQQLAEAQKQLAEQQQVAQVLADAVTKAEQALQKVPDDAEIKQATQVLVARRDKLQGELTALQQALPPREQRAKAMAEQLAAAQQNLATAKAEQEMLTKAIPEQEAALPTAQQQAAADHVALQRSLEQSVHDWSQHFGVGALEPLSPEQLAWSMLTVTGTLDQFRAAALADVNKKLPLDPQAPADPAKIAERERLIEQQVHEKGKGIVNAFVGLFGHSSGQPQRDFFATVDQALYFANAGVLQSWLAPQGDNLLGRLVTLTEPPQVAEELYLSVLIRQPSEAEVAAVTQYLQPRAADRPVALQELAWALITSAEFRFSH